MQFKSIKCVRLKWQIFHINHILLYIKGLFFLFYLPGSHMLFQNRESCHGWMRGMVIIEKNHQREKVSSKYVNIKKPGVSRPFFSGANTPREKRVKLPKVSRGSYTPIETIRISAQKSVAEIPSEGVPERVGERTKTSNQFLSYPGVFLNRLMTSLWNRTVMECRRGNGESTESRGECQPASTEHTSPPKTTMSHPGKDKALPPFWKTR